MRHAGISLFSHYMTIQYAYYDLRNEYDTFGEKIYLNPIAIKCFVFK